MFAVNHAATALLLKKRWKDAPLVWLLGSVQVLEIVWVVLNALGIERTTTEDAVSYVGDIHLSYMPYSHSLAMSAVIAAVSWFLARAVYKSSGIAIAVGAGVLSHIVLDLLTHAPDIALSPWSDFKIGFGLYAAFPLLAFFVELTYGVICWWVFRGGAGLLAVIVFFNLSNATMFLPGFVGIEGLLAGRPLCIVALVAAQIVITLVLIGWLANRELTTREEHANQAMV